jgi:DNA-binding NarL/FixJ family response regulator
VLSQHADAAYALELLKDGSAGYAYLLKDRLGEIGELLRALREVVEGGSLIDPRVVESLVAQRRRAEQSPLAELTPRELEVMQAMAEGRTNKGIGETLFLSESSVEKHVAQIFGKLGLAQEAQVHRRVSAVLTFLRERTD